MEKIMFKIKNFSLAALLCLMTGTFSFLKGMELKISLVEEGTTFIDRVEGEISLVKNHRPLYPDLTNDSKANSAVSLSKIFTYDNDPNILSNDLLVKCKFNSPLKISKNCCEDITNNSYIHDFFHGNITQIRYFPLSLFIGNTGELMKEGKKIDISRVSFTCKNGEVPFQEELLNCIKLCKSNPKWYGFEENKKKLLEQEILTEDKYGNVSHGKKGFDFDKIEKMRGKSKYLFAALFGGISIAFFGAFFFMYRHYPDFFSFKKFYKSHNIFVN